MRRSVVIAQVAMPLLSLALLHGAFVRRLSAQAVADTTTSTAVSVASSLSTILKPRLIGPAVTGGRISSITVHPENPGIMYVGVASGGVFKTDNGGASWTPIFDRQSSYSIGTVVLDPRNPNTVWVGTGENNSQRGVWRRRLSFRRCRQELEAYGARKI